MLYDYSLSKAGEIAAQVTTLDRPNEIFTLSGGKLTRITHANDEHLAKLKLAQGEYVHFKSKDGTTVSGYLYKPIDYAPGKNAIVQKILAAAGLSADERARINASNAVTRSMGD